MKKLYVILIIAVITSCSNNNASNSNSTSTESETVSAFLQNVNSLKNIEEGNPIAQFAAEAENVAAASFSLKKNGAKDLFETAKTYKHCVVIVEDHTIVKITDFEDCKQSGSWSACMPMGKGFVKRGKLESEKDYINNIIGTPDTQNRKVYLFN
ncbi:MAG: hypothetical protein ACPGLV_17975 [Bacteroidia bacterium]